MLDGLYSLLIASKDILSIGSSVAVIISTIFVAVQAKLFFSDCKKRNKKEEFGKSFELTQFYTTKILPQMAAVEKLYQSCDVIKFIKLIKADLKYFDREECKQYIDSEIFRQQLLQRLHSQNNDEIFYLYSEFYDVPLPDVLRDYYRYIHLINDNPDREKLIKTYEFNIIAKIMTKVSIVSNDLEYFSMFFNSNLAESEAVYESLHQTYLSNVRLLYPIICHSNTSTDCSKKYYTHIKELYTAWYAKECLIKAEQEKVIRKTERKNAKI